MILITAESSEVKELFFKSIEISSPFLLRGEKQVKMTKKKKNPYFVCFKGRLQYCIKISP